MFTARITKYSDCEPVVADEVGRGDPRRFFCPECRGEVRRKGGPYVRAHFAHLAGLRAEECNLASESKAHMDLKWSIYKAARDSGKFSRVLLEHKIGDSRCDVALIGKVSAAVEVQLSPISRRDIVRRMKEHWRHGFYTLWIASPQDIEGDAWEASWERKRVSARAFLRDIHEMTGGALLFYLGEMNFTFAHILGESANSKDYCIENVSYSFTQLAPIHLNVNESQLDEKLQPIYLRGQPRQYSDYVALTIPIKDRWWSDLRNVEAAKAKRMAGRSRSPLRI